MQSNVRSCLRDQEVGLSPLDTSDGAVFAGSSRRRIVSSISAFRPLANEITVPVIANPAFCSTLSDPTLSLATRANSGRIGTDSRSRASARPAMPCPQKDLSIQYVTSVSPSMTKLAMLPTSRPSTV